MVNKHGQTFRAISPNRLLFPSYPFQICFNLHTVLPNTMYMNAIALRPFSVVPNGRVRSVQREFFVAGSTWTIEHTLRQRLVYRSSTFLARSRWSRVKWLHVLSTILSPFCEWITLLRQLAFEASLRGPPALHVIAARVGFFEPRKSKVKLVKLVKSKVRASSKLAGRNFYGLYSQFRNSRLGDVYAKLQGPAFRLQLFAIWLQLNAIAVESSLIPLIRRVL